jgi:hypothetical protein
MMSMQKVGSNRTVRSLLLLAAVTCLPTMAVGDDKAPASVMDLVPAGLRIEDQNWVFENYEAENYDEPVADDGSYPMLQFQRFDWDVRASFPGSVTCDFTIGPELKMSIQSDSLWDPSSGNFELWEQTTSNDRNSEASAKSRFEFINQSISATAGELAVSEPQLEQVPNGYINWVEFSWKCPKNPGGQNIWMDGYANRGATVLKFYFWSNASRAEAVEMANEIMAKFDKLDLEEIRRQGEAPAFQP